MIAAEELYLQQIRGIPRLTPEEEHRLALRCAAGDPEAICQMVDANLALVVAVAKSYSGSGVPLLDLVQEGSIGLLTAAKKFDPSLGYRFSTYATKWIRHGVTACIRKHSGMIRLSQRTAEKARKIALARQELGEQASLEEIARHCGMDPQQVEATLALVPEVLSIDESPVQELLEDMQMPQPQQELVRQELKRSLEELMQQLTSRQQQVLRLRFGMEDGVCHPLSAIGQLLGISKERARQIEGEALKKLQQLSASTGLEDFLDP